MGMTSHRPPRVLAIASGGGHWIQLLRMRPAWEGCEVVYASTRPSDREDVAGAPFRVVPDANRWVKWRALWCAVRVGALVIAQRPDTVVTTGALPGYFAVVTGRLIRARTVWVDSVANVDELSMSGRWAGPHADVWLTQWSHLSTPDGPTYRGTVFG